ncbi:MAG: DegV family protein [Oscillospiraceae bacterium]|nr:DegV family protein [Oscillospiraceae bacterium]
MKIKIMVDTSSDISHETAEKYDISVLPILSVFGDKTYDTWNDITNKEFFQMLKDSEEIPTTAQTPYTVMRETLLEAARTYDAVIVFTISSKASGQYSTLNTVKNDITENELPDADIRIIDTMSFTVLIAQTAVYASHLAAEGKSADEIEQLSKDYLKSWDIAFVVGDLLYLQKGGRISKAVMAIGTLLDIKPVLAIRNGLIESVDKFRGKKNIPSKLMKKIISDPKFDKERNEFLVAASDSNMGVEFSALLKENNARLTMYGEIGPIIGTHTGEGTLAAFYRIKRNM